MAITDQLVHLMGGEIVIDSMVGKGSDFSVYLTLPIAENPDVQEEQEEEEDVDFTFNGCHILMAEDNEINAMIAIEILQEMGKDNIRLIVNRVNKKLVAAMHLTVDDVMDRTGLPLLGLVPEDPNVTLAAASSKPLLYQTKRGAAAACRRIWITVIFRACGWRPGRSWPPCARRTWARRAAYPAYPPPMLRR